MPQLHYVIGDALEPIKKPALIIHCCNDIGKMGRGFVVPMADKYPKAKKDYLNWFATGKPNLGDVQFVQVTPDICIGNMIAQHDNKPINGIPPIRYSALEVCLIVAFKKAEAENLIVAGPRFGAALAGGNWDIIERLIKSNMSVDTYIYTLESEKDKWPQNYEVTK